MSDFAIVTGGARNIGAAICERLSADCVRVAVVDREEPQHSHLNEFIRVNLGDGDATSKALSSFCNGRRVTRLVNNAGVVMPAPLEESDAESFDQVMDINVKAAMLCAQAVLGSMREAGIGRIVNVSSRSEERRGGDER